MSDDAEVKFSENVDVAPFKRPYNPWLVDGAMIVTITSTMGRMCSFEQAREAISWQAAEIKRLQNKQAV